MNFYFLLSVILVQILPFSLAHSDSDYVKLVKQVKGDNYFNVEVVKNEVN